MSRVSKICLPLFSSSSLVLYLINATFLKGLNLTPFQTWCLQAGLSEADCSQVSGSMWLSFSDALRVSLNLSFGRPLFLLPSASSLCKSCLGRRLSSIRKHGQPILAEIFSRERRHFQLLPFPVPQCQGFCPPTWCVGCFVSNACGKS